MRSLLAGLAVGLFATSAYADGVTVGSCSQDVTSDPITCPVNLVKGQDYELIGGGDEQSGTIELVNPLGTTTVIIQGNGNFTDGREFRAAYTATYQLRLNGDELAAAILTDCRADAKTNCRLVPGTKVSSVNEPIGDIDWYTASLRAGRAYTFTVNAGQLTKVSVLDKNGRVVARGRADNGTPAVIRYRPRAAGTYYAVVTRSFQYTIGLK